MIIFEMISFLREMIRCFRVELFIEGVCVYVCVSCHGLIVLFLYLFVTDIAPAYRVNSEGRWEAVSCRARHVLCVIVPYHARPQHLQHFLSIIPEFLQKQWLAYNIIIVEQVKIIIQIKKRGM